MILMPSFVVPFSQQCTGLFVGLQLYKCLDYIAPKTWVTFIVKNSLAKQRLKVQTIVWPRMKQA